MALNKTQHEIIVELQAELAKAQAENDQLREAALLSHQTRDKVIEGAGKQLERMAQLEAENARLKQYNDELCGDLLDQRGKLRDLLGPTVELLASLLDQHDRTMQEAVTDGNSDGFCLYAGDAGRTRTELARLRAAREGK